MKKRLLSALLALALVFVLLPTTALADTTPVTDENVKINGTAVIVGNDISLGEGNGTYSYDKATHTLTLNSATITTTGNIGISFGVPVKRNIDYKIELIGTNTISSTSAQAIYVEYDSDLDQQGTQKLSTLTINGSAGSQLILNASGYEKEAIWSKGDFTLSGGTAVTAFSSGEIAVNVGSMTINNSKLSAQSSSYGTTVVLYGFEMIGDAAEFEALNTSSGVRAVLRTSGASENIDWSNYQFTTGSYSGNALTKSEPTVCDKNTLNELFSSSSTTRYIHIAKRTIPALEKSNVYVAGTNLYKNTAYTIQNGKPVMGGTYPGNYNIYFDATDYVLHVKDAVIEATGNVRGTRGIDGTSDIVFEGDNSITASSYGIYLDFKSSDLKISGTGSLEVKTIAGDPAIATAYDTSRSIIISGNDFTVTADTSGTTSYAIKSDKDLTITGGAAVIAKSNEKRAINVNGSLTVTNGSLTATSKSNNVPTVQVDGNASFTGSTVTITNNSTTQGKQYEDSNAASSALHVNGAVTISGGTVTAEAKAGGNAIRAVGNITVSDGATVTATNNSQHFSAITAGQASGGVVNNLSKLIVSGETTKITATNSYANSSTGAIHAKIKNANEGHYLQVGTGTDTKAIAPNVNTTVRNNSLTITRGDKVTRTNSPVVIAGTTLLNDTFYTINGSTVAEGTESNYNAFYNSTTKTLKLNNAQISHSFAHEYGGGQDGAIIFKEFENYFIELSGENTISSTNTYAINCYRPDRTLTIKNAAEAENAKLTLTSNWMVICSIGGLNIQSDVTMVNTKEAGYLMYVNDTFSFDGYNAYASVNASGSPLVEYTVPTSGDKDAGYQYLRITKETLETGGGSTHEHVFSTSWESNADYHWHKCTVQGCTEVSDKEEHVYTNTWWKNSNGNHGRTCDKCRHEGEIHEFRKYYNFVDATYHVERCSYPNCTYVGSNETHSYDSFGTCKCGYNPNGLPAPPSLQGVAPTSENGTDGKILNSNIGMEYAQNLNGPWTKWNEHSNITGLSAGTYYVRYTKTDERFPDNQVATVEVPAYTPGGDPTPDIPAAPTGLVGVAPTSENGNGKITGTTAQMEYASSLEGDWTTCANDSTDVPAGKYYVRMKKTDNTPAGEVVEVTVPAYSGTGEIVPPTPAQQPNPSTGANDLVGLAVAAAVAAALGSAALLRKHD